ncbi:MAG: hypothetical protein L3V56_00660 [Candidatus Magnetoovum sp. WYHC-5]|nr:hypothetical protein [Candidatus Magnetoovum sp. WYHC-5]
MNANTLNNRVLMLAGDIDFQSTAGRLIYLARSLTQNGFDVDIMTYSKSVFSFCDKFAKNLNVRIRVLLRVPQILPVEHTVTLVNSYIKLIYDMELPQTDLKLYKVTAFDDFRGHLVNFTYTDIDIKPYNAILLPMITTETPPMPDSDIFYSTICFFAKELSVPIIGINIFPVIQTPSLLYWIIDYFIVKDKWEKTYLLNYGVEEERVLILDYKIDAYYIEPIEDKYMDYILNPGINFSKNELVIVVVNHPRLRFCVTDILDVIHKLEVPKFMIFLKRNFFVRELSEDDVLKEFFLEDIKNINGRSMVLEPESKTVALMACDIIISPSHLTTLDFVARYNKDAVVYNPLNIEEDLNMNISFTKTKEELMTALIKCYEKKQALMGISDIVSRVLNRIQ